MSGVLLRQRLPLVPYYDKEFTVPAQDLRALNVNHHLKHTRRPFILSPHSL
jgi:hypothetical protein